MKSNKSKAEKILKENLSEDKVIFTEDGQAFFSGLKAKNHAKTRGFEEEPEVFFREGAEPEDVQGLQEELDTYVERNELLEETLAEVSKAADPEAEPLTITKDTPAEVVAVVQLKEKLQAVENELKAIKETSVTDESAGDKKEVNKTKKSK